MIRVFFDEMEARHETLGQTAAATIAIDHLLKHTPIRPEELAVLAQRTPADALEALGRLERIGLLERLLNRSLSFRLTPSARERLGAAVHYRRSTIDEHWDLVRPYLDEHPDISREEASRLLEVTPLRATDILTALRNSGRLAHVGRSRGRSVRYRPA